MNINPLNHLSSQSEEFTYQVLLETETSGQVTATLWGLPECKAMGKSRDEVINNVTELIGDRINHAELVSVNIMRDKPKNNWLKFAGMYQDNPVFDEVISYMESERTQIDEELE